MVELKSWEYQAAVNIIGEKEVDRLAWQCSGTSEFWAYFSERLSPNEAEQFQELIREGPPK